MGIVDNKIFKITEKLKKKNDGKIGKRLNEIPRKKISQQF